MLNEKQLKIVQATDPKIIVEACPACGKTNVLVERVKFLINKGVEPSRIVAITFTNAAASEMRERLGDEAKDMFIGTVHSYANTLLYCYGIDTITLLRLERFDELFRLVEENSGCIKPIDHLLLDEAQDSNSAQYNFLLNTLKPKNFFFVGDPRQAIYVWANKEPDILFDLEKQEGVVTYYLNQNYRNSRNVLAFAKSLILLAGNKYKDISIPMRNEQGKVIDANYSIVGICRYLKKDNDYKNWFILCRTNEELGILMREFEIRDIPFSLIKHNDLSKNELSAIMEQDTVKLMTIHAAKGLESNKVMVIGARYYNSEEVCVSYVAATRARDLLVWVKSPKTKMKKVQQWE